MQFPRNDLIEHTAIQVSLNQLWLVANVSCQHCSMIAVMSVDSLTCYHSAAHPSASIACQCLGAPWFILCTVFQSIQMMNFYRKHTVTQKIYRGGTTTHPFQGICQGQGNRAGLVIWLVVSIVLIEMVQLHGYLATLSHASDFVPVHWFTCSPKFGWLQIICNLSQWRTPTDSIIQQLQHDSNLWQGFSCQRWFPFSN